ncbi:MAG: FMN-binding negative transcriptional regulator [Gammaproteobacteria bacterium]|nr:FMN-binding negative transcriptional regulator [Gammaproteobacteria bacterium]
MYLPKSFENKNLEQLHELIEKFNFATLISHYNGETEVTHIPVMLNRSLGEYGTLFWHVANLNPHAKLFTENTSALLIFHGPHGYISPTWYKTASNVPTWNYAVVHAHGIVQIMDKKELADNLTSMVNWHENAFVQNTRYIISNEFKSKQIEYITGFSMAITKIEGKFKLSQNRSSEDRHGVLDGLRSHNTSDSNALADLMESINNSA